MAVKSRAWALLTERPSENWQKPAHNALFDLGAEEATKVFETNLPAENRLKHGQYYTPYALCDFMLALACNVKSPERVLEPACGGGNFLVRILEARELIAPKITHLVGIEQNPDALQFAKNSLDAVTGDLKAELVQEDFLTIVPPKLSNFDLIIGNPPYVRQELLGETQAGDKFNRLNQFRNSFENYLAEFPEQSGLFSRKADLYQWFFLQAYQTLQPGGVLAFVVSNSWLDTVFGKHLRHFLQHHFDWLYLVESACERWFEDAAINPIIVVLQKKKRPGERSEQVCRILRLLQPVADYLPDAQTRDYWIQLRQTIQTLPTSAKIQFQALQPEQLETIERSGGWNVALRAPDLLGRLISMETLWQPLETLGKVRYPVKTGINAFFYLDKLKASQWGIEHEFLLPVIRSARKVQYLKVTPDCLEEFLFCCPHSKEQLQADGKTGALAYVEWGERQTALPRQKRAQATPWPDIPSVQNNRPWHAAKRLAPPHILCSRFIDQRYFFALCAGDLVEDQTFYGLTIQEPNLYPPDLIAGLLNSTLSCALLEFRGRASLGEGVLQFARCDMAALPILKPDLYTPAEREAIRLAFTELARHPLNRWQQDWNLPARIALDEAVLTPLLKHLPFHTDALALRMELAQAILGRSQERKVMAQSARKKAKPRQD